MNRQKDAIYFKARILIHDKLTPGIKGSSYPYDALLAVGVWDGKTNDDDVFYWLDDSAEYLPKELEKRLPLDIDGLFNIVKQELFEE